MATDEQKCLQRIEQHERVCSERYKQIESNQRDAKAERGRMHRENATAIAAIGGRVDRLYNRAWAVAWAIMGAEGMIIVGMVGYALKKMFP